MTRWGTSIFMCRRSIDKTVSLPQWALHDRGIRYIYYYSNDLNKMATHLDINASVLNYNGAVVKNFSSQCYAKDLYIGVRYRTDQSVTATPAQLFDQLEVLSDSTHQKFVYKVSREHFAEGKGNCLPLCMFFPLLIKKTYFFPEKSFLM